MSSAATVAKCVDNERLNSLGERFRIWQKRDKNSIFQMPSYLWDEAFDFVDVLGVRRVARELGVNRDELTRRMAEAQAPARATARSPQSEAAGLPENPAVESAPQTAAEPEADVDVKPVQFVDIDLELPGVLASPPPAEMSSADVVPPVMPEPDPAPALPAAEQSDAPVERTASSPAATDSRPVVPSAEEAFLEVLDTDGVKLSIRIPVAHVMNVSALIRDFRSRP